MKTNDLETALKKSTPAEIKINTVAYVRGPRWEGFMLITDLTQDKNTVIGYQLRLLIYDTDYYVVVLGPQHADIRYIRELYGRPYAGIISDAPDEYAPLDNDALIDILKRRNTALRIWKKAAATTTVFDIEKRLGKPLDIDYD